APSLAAGRTDLGRQRSALLGSASRNQVCAGERGFAGQPRSLLGLLPPSEDDVPEDGRVHLLELVSELDQVVRRSLLEARDDDQGVYVLGPRATALRLEERRRVDHDECERRLAQLVEQDLKRIRGYERRRRGLACAQDGEAAGPAPGRSRSGRL